MAKRSTEEEYCYGSSLEASVSKKVGDYWSYSSISK